MYAAESLQFREELGKTTEPAVASLEPCLIFEQVFKVREYCGSWRRGSFWLAWPGKPCGEGGWVLGLGGWVRIAKAHGTRGEGTV